MEFHGKGRAVGAQGERLERRVAGVLELLHDLRPGVDRREIGQAAPDHLLAFQSQHVEQCPIDVEDAPLVVDQDALERRLRQDAQAPLALARRVLRRGARLDLAAQPPVGGVELLAQPFLVMAQPQRLRDGLAHTPGGERHHGDIEEHEQTRDLGRRRIQGKQPQRVRERGGQQVSEIDPQTADKKATAPAVRPPSTSPMKS